MERYRILEHTADVGLVAYGADLREAFANAALGMVDQVVDLDGVAERESWSVESRAECLESLLVRWLNDILYLMGTEGAVPGRIEVRELENTRITALLHGERLSPDRHTVKAEVKAATHHLVEVSPDPVPHVQVILDM